MKKLKKYFFYFFGSLVDDRKVSIKLKLNAYSKNIFLADMTFSIIFLNENSLFELTFMAKTISPKYSKCIE